MNLKNYREDEIANLIDAGKSYAYIEAQLDVYPSLISRVVFKMKLTRLTTPISVGCWHLPSEEEKEFRLAEAIKEARRLLPMFKNE